MSFLEQATTDARRRANSLVANAKRLGPGATFIGGRSGFESASRGTQTLAQHSEQLRHFTGYVYAIIRTIANRIAGQPLRVARAGPKKPTAGPKSRRYSKRPRRFKAWKPFVPRSLKSKLEGGRVIENHPVHDIFDSPNPIMVRYTLWFVTIASLELTGKAFWWIRRRPGKQTEIWPLPPSWIDPIHDEDQLYARWKVKTPGTAEPFEVPGPEIAYFYYPDPADPLGATSPLQALARAVTSDEAMEEGQRRAHLNGVNPGMAFVVGNMQAVAGVSAGPRPILTKEQRSTLINAVKAQYRGVMNNEEPLILDGLISDVKKITNSPREMDFLQSMVATRGRMSQGWGVNPLSMGEMNATRAESSVADEHLVSNVLRPRLEMIGEILTAKVAPLLAPDEPDLILYLEDIRSTDPDAEAALDGQMVSQATMSRNEWRARRNLPPLVGGDSAYIGGQLVPVVVERPGQPKTPWPEDDTTPGSEEVTDDDPADADLPPEQDQPPAPKSSLARQLGKKAVAALWSKARADAEAAVESALSLALADLLIKSRDLLAAPLSLPQPPDAATLDALTPALWKDALQSFLPTVRPISLKAAARQHALYARQRLRDRLPVAVTRKAINIEAILDSPPALSILDALKSGLSDRLADLHDLGLRGPDLANRLTADALALAPAKEAIAIAAPLIAASLLDYGRDAATADL